MDITPKQLREARDLFAAMLQRKTKEAEWRLLTLEEAMSLMESERKHENLYIDPVFDAKQL